MAKESVIQASFSAGELSPHLHDRVDLEAYYAGCAELENFIPLPHGPILRRRGTRFIQEARNSKVRLVPFTFNLSQSYVLEFTNRCIRIYHDTGILLNADGHILEVPSPFEEQDLPNINWAQNGDWLSIVDGRHAPQVLKRYSNTDWRVEALVFSNQPAEWGPGNYPRIIALFEQRAYYAATPRQPQQVWASRTGLYEDFTMRNGDTILDDHAFSYTIFSNDTNGIEWMLAMGALIIGTAGAEFKMGSTSAIDPITPKNVRISVQTHYGSADVRPVRIGSSVIFVQRSRNRIRAFEYSFSEDQYTAQDLTIFASHVLSGRVREMQVQSAPDSYIWIVTEAGELVGCTYEKNQKVLAWHRHTTLGKFLSACILSTRGNDKVYVAVERVINGRTRTFIEVLVDAWEAVEEATYAFYVDSGLTYQGPATTSIVGLQHLEGETVSVLVDGWVHPSIVVKHGSLTLQYPGSVVTVGIPYKSEFLSLIPQSQQRVTVGATRRISEATVALEKSADFFYKAAVETNAEIAYDGPTKVMNRAVPLTSRHHTISVVGKSEKTAQLQLWQDKPLPLTIRGIVYTINPSSL